MAEPVSLQTLLTYLTLISVPVGVVYHIMTLRANRRNQELSLRAQEQALETRQPQMFMQIYNQSHNDPSFIGAWQRFTKIKWDTIEDFERTGNPVTPEDALDSQALARVAMFYEGLGCLVKEDYVPIRLVALLMTGMTRHFWEKYIPIIEEARKRKGFRRFMSEAEYLYDELMRYTEEHPELAT